MLARTQPSAPFPSPQVSTAQLVLPYGFTAENPLFQYWRIFATHKWAILGCTIVVLLLGTVYTIRKAPLYEAVGRVAINREASLSLGLRDVESVDTDYVDYNVALETQVRILQSDRIVFQTVKNLNLAANPAFMPGGSAPDNINPLQVDSPKDSAILGRFRRGLKVDVVPRTRIIEVHYTDADPRLATQIVNGLINTYVEENLKAKYLAVTQTTEWLSKQLNDLQLKVEVSQEKLVRYQRENNILGLDEKQNIVTSKLDDLNKQLTEAESDRIQKQSAYELTQRGDAEGLIRGEGSALLGNLLTQEADLKSQLAQANTRFGPSYPTVQALNNQLNQLQTSIRNETKRLNERIRDEYLMAARREKMLRDALNAQKQQANQLNEASIEYIRLKRDADSNRQLYEGLQQRLKEASVAAGLKTTNIRIVDLARVPSSPSSPNVPRNVLLSLVMGLACGVGLALTLETLDTSVRLPEQAELISGLVTLATIPLGDVNTSGLRKALARPSGDPIKAAWSQPLTLASPKSHVTESFRALRTSVLLAGVGSPPKILMITSPLPQEGKTTVSVNTAVVLAQNGARVLLIDSDMRRPSVHLQLGIKNLVGLSSLLSGTAEVEPSPHPSIDNLWVLPSGPVPPHPAELLASQRMAGLLESWQKQYDHVLIDTPPVLTVTDAVLLSTKAEGVIMVVRAGETAKAALARACELLRLVGAPVKGVVFNGVNTQTEYYQRRYYGAYGEYYQ